MNRCEICHQAYDGSCRPPMTAGCGHTACCWAGRSKCPICNTPFTSDLLTREYPIAARDLTSPEPMDFGGAASSSTSPAGQNKNAAMLDVRSMHGQVKMSVDAATTSVNKVKESLFEATGVDTRRQTLIYKGKPMTQEKKTLSSYGVTNGSQARVEMGTRCNGG